MKQSFWEWKDPLNSEIPKKSLFFWRPPHLDEEGRREGFAKPIRTVSEGEGLRQAMKIFIGHQFKRPENKKGKQLSKIKVIKVLLQNLKFEQIFPHV